MVACYLELLLSIALGIANGVTVKLSDGYTRKGWTVVAYGAYALATVFFVFAIVSIPLGAAYAIYEGLVTGAVCVIGIAVWKESLSVKKAVALICIVVGVVLLELGLNA